MRERMARPLALRTKDEEGEKVSPVNLLLMAANSVDASLVDPAATSSSASSFIFPSSSSSSHAWSSSSSSPSQQLAPTAGSLAQLPLGSSSAHHSHSTHESFDQIGNNTSNNGTTDSHGDSSGHSTTVTSFTDDKDIEDTLISITSTGNWTIASAIAAPFTGNLTRTSTRTRTSTSNNGNSQGNEVTRASGSWRALCIHSFHGHNIAPLSGPIINSHHRFFLLSPLAADTSPQLALASPVENVNCTEATPSETLMPQQKPHATPMVPVEEANGQINDFSKMLPAADAAITSLNGNSQSLMSTSADGRNSGRVNSLFTHSTGSSDQVYQSDASSQSLASQAPVKQVQEVDQSGLMFNHETITASSFSGSNGIGIGIGSGIGPTGGSNKLKYVSEGTRSWLYLTPKSKDDYGVFECWATNIVGKQVKPCVFTVTPVGEFFSFFLFPVSSSVFAWHSLSFFLSLSLSLSLSLHFTPQDRLNRWKSAQFTMNHLLHHLVHLPLRTLFLLPRRLWQVTWWFLVLLDMTEG